MSVPDWLAVALAGGSGAVVRFVIDQQVSARRGDLPLGTFAINLSGSFALGLIAGLALSGTAATIAGSAAVGAYTTFSTWMLETHRLREDGELALAAANVVASLLAGLAAVTVGHLLGSAL